MFTVAASEKLRELLAKSLIHFAESAPDVSAPPASLQETLELGGASGGAAPFHFALFPEVVRFKTLERSFSSALGSTFEEIALIIGRERYGFGERQHVVEGRLRATANAAIDQIIKDYETLVARGQRARVPDLEAEYALLNPLLGPGGEDHKEIVDLHLRGEDGVGHYFHMKTVKPNKDQSNKAKRLMLRVHALQHPAPTRVFFGMAYNPYGEGNAYKWSFAKPYFDFEREVLIGGNFWDYLGGAGTFPELMKLCIETGLNVHGQIVRELGLT